MCAATLGSKCLRLLLLCCITYPAFCQAPQVNANGVVNAASYAQPIAPGSIVSIFGSNLAVATAAAVKTPLPAQLDGTWVTVNGIQAPLFFVSPGQINFQVPSSVPFSYAGFSTVEVIVTTAAGLSAPVEVPFNQTSPAVFTTDASGCGQAVALNVAPDGTYSVNSALNSAAQGDYIVLFGNGFGTAEYAQPPDGVAPSGAAQMPYAGGGIVDGEPLTLLSYFGLAPGLVGVDQANFQIPADTRDGCAVPVAIETALISPTVTISIHSGRGHCVDPPTQSYGNISLTRTIATGTGHDGKRILSPRPSCLDRGSSVPNSPNCNLAVILPTITSRSPLPDRAWLGTRDCRRVLFKSKDRLVPLPYRRLRPKTAP
jgi:uncharacterized protein (TIGR03437 family)